MDNQQQQIDGNNNLVVDNQKEDQIPMQKSGGASVYGMELNPTIKKEMKEYKINVDDGNDEEEDAMPQKINNSIKQLKSKGQTSNETTGTQEQLYASPSILEGQSNQSEIDTAVPYARSQTGAKFRKKGINELLTGGSPDQNNAESTHGNNVRVAPNRDLVISTNQSVDLRDDKTQKLSLNPSSAITTFTPKSGSKMSDPFQLSVPESEPITNFDPSLQNDFKSYQKVNHSETLRNRKQKSLQSSQDPTKPPTYQLSTKNKKQTEEDELLDKIKMEKQYYKLADYFCTVGLDDYYTQEEIYKEEDGQKEETRKSVLDVPSVEQSKSKVDGKNLCEDFKIIEEDGLQWDRIIKSLEIFVIEDPGIFDKDIEINGVRTSYKHPKDVDDPNERWIDLRGDQLIYLKVNYDNIKNVKRPISDLNFYKISKFGGSSSSNQNAFPPKQNKMQIHVRQGIEPIPVKVFGDPDAEKKIHKTKKLGKNGNKNEDMYNFYGDYDLTSFFEGSDPQDAQSQRKNLCLCVSTKKAAPIQDLILVIGQQIQATVRQEPNQKPVDNAQQNMTINWEVPEGYKKLAYSVGTKGLLNRLLCLKTRDLTKQMIKAKILDRYPHEGQDRHYYPFPNSISEFCFPSGIQLKYQQGSPEYFNFNLTDSNGSYIYGSCLIFDEEPSRAMKDKLRSQYVKNASSIRTIKAICILSHYSFNNAFKDILCQLYRMQLSSSRLNIPLERYIINIIDEIPLPDEGKILIQHELRDKTAQFYRPIDQIPPIIEESDVENLFKSLSVDNIIEIYTYLLLERKVLFISEHKSLLTQVINCFNSFLFPFQWKHTMIPILPVQMTDILEAPFPYLIGIEPTPKLEQLDIESEVLVVDLDKSEVRCPEELMQQSNMPQMPFKESRHLKQRLNKASEHIMQVPDEQMLKTVDLAFNKIFADPEEEESINHLEVRDAFLEFISSIMSGYTKYLKDLGEQPEMITNITSAKDCFDMIGFRLQKDAKKPYTFVYKLTETTHFAYFIECRALGRTEYDQQIIFFEKLLQQKRTLMNPRLTFPFAEEKSIKSMQPNEEGLEGKSWGYKIFPKMNPQWYLSPRVIPDYNKDSIYQQIMGSLIRNEELTKMHDDEFSRYMVEVLFLLWFQVFCTTLPIYGSYAPQLIEFARRLLNHVKNKIKPMRDVEFIYRRLFESCGTCKQAKELIEINKEMKKSKIQPDKVTSGTFYQALLECKRRGGVKEDESDKRRSYFAHRIEDYQDRLSQNCNDDDYMDPKNSKFRFSNLSQGQKIGEPAVKIGSTTSAKNNFMSPPASDQLGVFDENQNVVDFQDLLGNQQTQVDTMPNNRLSNPMKLSHILENSFFLDIEKTCQKCKQTLREEEMFSGFQKSLSNYTVKCPICHQQYVPKFTIYSEQENLYLNGRKGVTVHLLPPITLYKEFFNILMKEGDQILMNEDFINNHKIIFWNIILYFKVLKLPIFMLDLDFTPHHQRVHCSQIKKFLPIEKNISNLFGRKNSTSRQQNLLPPSVKLDSSALKKLNEIESSPQRIGQFAPSGNILNMNKSGAKKSGSLKRTSDGSFIDYDQNSGQQPQVPTHGSSNRPSSIKRVANQVMGIFNNQNKQQAQQQQLDLPPNMQNQQVDANNNDSMQNNDLNLANYDSADGAQVPLDKSKSLPPKNQKKGNWNQNTQQQAIRQQIVNAQMQNPQQQQLQLGGGGHAHSQAEPNDKKGFHGVVGNFINGIKKSTGSQKSAGKAGSKKSGGPGSVGTTLSDLEKIEKIMNEAVHAKKSVVKYFGSYFEEFRREMHYNKEIVLSDILTQFGTGLNEKDINGK